MKNFILIYRSGITFKKHFTDAQQGDISKQWHDWVASLGTSYIDSSSIIKGGWLVSENDIAEVEVNENMINGYILVQAISKDEVVDMCKRCPLFQVGKTFEIRELPNK
ncbi:MAG: hypothetical protein COA79_12960 [Planctomycetota bacterium]|nr:MAG: hypothetical protein COA79_12960 [Planctomycetota bacterium]